MVFIWFEFVFFLLVGSRGRTLQIQHFLLVLMPNILAADPRLLVAAQWGNPALNWDAVALLKAYQNRENLPRVQLCEIPNAQGLYCGCCPPRFLFLQLFSFGDSGGKICISLSVFCNIYIHICMYVYVF